MAAEDDIDRFIEEQKQKIAQERRDLQQSNIKQASEFVQNSAPLNGDLPLKENLPLHAALDNRKPNRSDGTGLPLGNYVDVRTKLLKERQEEYKKFLDEKNKRSAMQRSNLEGEGKSLPIGERNSAKERARIQRNKEYNEFLKQREHGRRRSGESSAAPLPTNGYSRTSGVNPHQATNSSLEALKSHREVASQTPIPRGYEDLPPRGPRKGWGTPQPLDYEDILRQKREEEMRYRRYDDLDYYQPRSLKPAHSDPYLNRYDEDGRRSSRRDPYDDYDRRRVHFSDEVPAGGPQRGPRGGELYDRSHRPRVQESLEEPLVYDWSQSKVGRSRTFTNDERPKPALRHEEPDRPPRAKSATHAEESSLPLGPRETESATRRKKQQYRKELEQQMQEAKEAKIREKESHRQPSVSAAKSPAPQPLSARQSGSQVAQPQGTQGQMVTQQVPQGYTPSFLNQPYGTRAPSASTAPYQGQYGVPSAPYGFGSTQVNELPVPQPIGDLGLKEAMAKSQPELLDRPFSLNYPQVSSLSQPGVNSTDPYMYYGMRNPLEPEPNSSMIHGLPHPTAATATTIVPPAPNLTSPLMERYLFLQQQQQQLIQQQQLVQQQQMLPGAGQQGQTFTNPAITRQTAAHLRGESSIKNFVGDDQLSPRSQADPKSYRAQLLLQMKEKEATKLAAMSEKAKYEAQKEREMEVYDPWGKGGGGAPMRDKQGKIVADLKQLHNRNESLLADPSRQDLQLYAGTKDAPPTNPAAAGQDVSPLLAAAAGGGGAVGAGPAYGKLKGPITTAAPNPSADASRNEYQEMLRQQVEDKKRREAEEKEKLRLEEEKEERRLAAQRERIKKEYEEELERKKKKEEQQRKQKEDLERQLEEKRKEAEQKKKEVNERRRKEADDKLRHRDLNYNVSNLNQRAVSPPIPTLREKNSTAEPQRIASPPIPTLRKKDEDNSGRRSKQPRKDDDYPTTSRGESPPLPAVSTKERGGPKDERHVMGALSAMRKQLASEQQRIQSQLDKHRDYDPYNPLPRAAHAPRRGSPQVDVFELARHKGNVAALRNMTHQAAEDFDGLKNRSSNTHSRQQLKDAFPNKPDSDISLEAQQRALLRAQQEKLEEMRKGKPTTATAVPNMNNIGRGSPSIPLDSDSAFIGIDTGETHMPAPMRSRIAPSPINVEDRKPRSVSTLRNDDLDMIIAKSQARSDAIETLHSNDDGDADDILDQFLSKKSYDSSRPASGKSEDLSLWLKPSTDS